MSIDYGHDRLFENAFEYAAIGTALVSLKGQWLRVNGSICNIVGYKEEELLQISFQDITHPDDLDAHLELLNKLIRGEIENYHLGKPIFTSRDILSGSY